MVEEIDKKTGVIEALSSVWVLRPRVSQSKIYFLAISTVLCYLFLQELGKRMNSMEMVANK